MAFMRIAHKWHKDDNHDIKEIAGSLLYNCWKFSLKSVRNLQQERFNFDSKTQGRGDDRDDDLSHPSYRPSNL